MAYEFVQTHAKHRESPLKGFVVFTAVAVASMLLAQNWRTFLPGAEGARSMWGGVKSAVYTVISQLS
jgi:light-harvesting complex 1 beta chain